MTEDEAKTKWCPFARVAAITNQESSPDLDNLSRGVPSYNRIAKAGGQGNDPVGACIGSACMAWREEVINHASWPADGTVDKTFPHSEGWRIVRSRLSDNTLELKRVSGRGYCGLAGAPQ